MALDQEKLNEMLHRGINDFGATLHATCVNIGDKLASIRDWRRADHKPLRSFAKRTSTTERYVREWLASQAGRRLRHARCGDWTLQPERGAGLHVGRRKQPRVSSRGFPGRPCSHQSHAQID